METLRTAVGIVVGSIIVVASLAVDVFIFLHWGLRGLMVAALIESIAIPTAIMLVALVVQGIGLAALALGKAVAGVFRHHPREAA